MRPPWQVNFIRPSVVGMAALQRDVPDVVEITIPLRPPDDLPRVQVEVEPLDAMSRKDHHLDEPGTVTLRLSETEVEVIAQAYLQARQDRLWQRSLERAGL